MNTYSLPILSYDLQALEPYISKEIMEVHYHKHHKGYVDNLNAALEKFEEADKNRDISLMLQSQKAIHFHGGGHANHTLFWESLSPKKTTLSPKLLDAIKKNFIDFEKFIARFSAEANGIQGSGWAWLGLKANELIIETTMNHDRPTSAPLMVIDVWEHAYYLQYKNKRADFVKAIWNIINWKNVSDNYEKAILL